MRQALTISVLGIAGAAGCTGFVMGIVQANAILCAGSVIGLCFVATRFVPRPRRTTGVVESMVEQPGDEPGNGEPRADNSAIGLGDTGACDRNELTAHMLREGRYALLARPQIARELTDPQRERALADLRESMALVPAGPVLMRHQIDDGESTAEQWPGHVVTVDALYLDRCCVTNRQYRAFIAAGGYEEMALWDPDVWPGVLDFVDRSGHPGPQFWCDGMYLRGEDDHPVVGISWFEARAYAQWVGKRLPTDPEWVKAASWPVAVGEETPVQRKYPWGDLMDRGRANLWGSGPGRSVAVSGLTEGASVSGVYQLCGNVWEWTAGDFGAWLPPSRQVELTMAMKAIRGGGFDTYFENQASCHFQSGENPLARKMNIGFRCALSLCDVADGELFITAADESNCEKPHEFACVEEQ